ncbi:hypothetical protein Mapa_009199 [Marchantia paleacea]|nr:hypothetical protein Mapa_009199 [Marchantia paleacea]
MRFMWWYIADQCSNKDISIIQNEEPNAGIPRYVVQIVNTCISDCAPTDIHVFCGWFASSPLVNPNYFKRLAYNDCLVNGGRPLAPGSVIQFQYANTFMYPMRFRSANFYVCTDKDISITQSRDGTTGIPLYSVQITNTCMSDCAPSDIHVNCGWFASSPPPNPNVFTRLAFNDCLVNGGKPLLQGNIIQFQYANSFMYPLTFKSAKFCRI